MKYKKGDKVFLREDLEVGVEYGGNVFINGMFKDCVVTIRRLNIYSYGIEEGNYNYTDEMIDHKKTALYQEALTKAHGTLEDVTDGTLYHNCEKGGLEFRDVMDGGVHLVLTFKGTDDYCTVYLNGKWAKEVSEKTDKPKFKVGDVCVAFNNYIVTIIKVDFCKSYQDFRYWFIDYDDYGKDVYSFKDDLSLCEPTTINTPKQDVLSEEKYDYTNPSHYKSMGKETFEMMIDIWGKEAFIKHCEMCAFKYRMRMGAKPDQPLERELSKVEWYENKAKELRDDNN